MYMRMHMTWNCVTAALWHSATSMHMQCMCNACAMHVQCMAQLGSPALEPAGAAAATTRAAVATTEAAAVIPSVAATMQGAGAAGAASARCLVFRTLCAVGAGEQLYLYYGRFSCLQTLQFYGA